MIGIITLAVTGAVVVLGYVNSRHFVRTRLRYVDAAQRKGAPIVAGVVAALVAAPVAWLLPFVGAGAALLFGVAIGTGVAHGARDVRRGTPGLLEP
jgi:O-antigen/teichoic acid export membrane protein